MKFGGDGDGGDGGDDGDNTSWWMRSNYGGGCEFRGLSLSSSLRKGMVSSHFILGLKSRCQRRVVRSVGTVARPYHCSLSSRAARNQIMLPW